MLEVKNISKSFGDNRVLRNVSLRLEAGQCIGLAGRNGCGKSTLLRIIAQIIPADGGDILADGKSIIGSRAFLRKKLGYVPQEDALAEFLTAGQQLRFWQSAIEAKNGEILELLDFSEIEKKTVLSLSGGQRRRLSIAMALQSDPGYLIMDEAFSALDKVYRERLALWLKEGLDKGRAVLWCSHDEAELAELCQNRIILRDGVTEII